MAFLDEDKLSLPFSYYMRAEEITGQIQYVEHNGDGPVVFPRLKQ